MEQDDSGASIREKIGDTFVIVESKIEITQKDIPYILPKKGEPTVESKFNVRIFADEVHISGSIKNPGKNILIVAQNISFSKDAVIDLSGASPLKDYKASDIAPQIDKKANAAGTQGPTGSDGLPSGNISIYTANLVNAENEEHILHLIAHGGRGGNGGTGHDGMTGGLPGDPTNSPRNGTQGANGGTGGQAGINGNGGKGGTIKVSIINPFQKKQIVADDPPAGGKPGEIGRVGQAGTGGPAPPHGYPGVNGVHPRSLLPDDLGTIGLPGKIEFHNGNPDFSEAELAQLIPLEQMQVIQYLADLSYLNKDYTGAIQRYLLLADNHSGTAYLTGDKPKSPNPIHDKMRAAIHQSSSIQLARIKQRLDFYGNAPDWVPLLTIQSLQERVDQLLILANAMKESIVHLEDEAKSNNDHMKALDKVHESMETDLDHISRNLHHTNADILHQEGMLRDLANNILNKEIIVLQQRAKFKADFEKDIGCKPNHVFKVCKSILKVVPEVLKSTKDMGEAAGKLKNSKSPIDGLKNGITVVKSVTTEVDTIKSAYNDVADAISPEKPDFAKIFVNEKEFDKMIADFTDKYTSAAGLKVAVHNYFQEVQIRNTQVVNFNAMFLQQKKLNAQHQQRGADIELFAAQLAESQANKITAIPKILAFLKRTDAVDRLFLLSKLYEEHKALEYWSLSKQPFTITRDLDGLREAHTKISQEIDSWKHYEGRPYSKFHDIRVPFTRELFVDAFSSMENTKHLLVSIPLDHPAFVNKFHVTVEEVIIKIEDGKTTTTGILGVEVVHCGVSQFKSTDGQTKHYSHQPRATYYEWNYDQKETTVPGTLGGTIEGYTGLSPFATWMIKFDLPGNEALNMKDLKKVELCFLGKMLGPDF